MLRRAEMARPHRCRHARDHLRRRFLPQPTRSAPRRVSVRGRHLAGPPPGNLAGRQRYRRCSRESRSGDVIAIPFSDVGWTPLFARAGRSDRRSGRDALAQQHRRARVPDPVCGLGARRYPTSRRSHGRGRRLFGHGHHRGNAMIRPGARIKPDLGESLVRGYLSRSSEGCPAAEDPHRLLAVDLARSLHPGQIRHHRPESDSTRRH